MVQDFTTSFDRFETFVLSEMAKQPDLKNDSFSPFTPKFWTNRESINSMIKSESLTSLYEAQLEGSIQYLSPRRSGRIANQTKINYNENVPKHNYKEKHNKRQKINNASPKNKAFNSNRIKAIRKLFKKPSDGESVKIKPKPETKSYKTRGRVSKVPSLKISIPLIHTKLLTTSMTKASLKLYEDVLTTEKPAHPYSLKMEVFDKKCDWSFKNIAKRKDQLKQKIVCEAFEDFQKGPQASSALKKIKTSTINNNLSTATKSENVSEGSFSGIFKNNKENNEVAFVWKQNEKLKQSPTEKTFEEKKFNTTSEASRKFANGFLENKSKGSTNLIDSIEAIKDRSLDDLMEVTSEIQVKPKNLEATNKDFNYYQMMEVSNESTECLDENPQKPVQHDNEVFEKTSNPEQSSTREASTENEFPLDLSIMDVSQETNNTWKPNKIQVRSKSITTEYEFSENSTITEDSSDVSLPRVKKISSYKATKFSPIKRLSIFDSFKKNTQIDGRNTPSSLANKECSLLSDNLSTMKISHKNHKSKNLNTNAFEHTEEPFDLTMTEVQNSKTTEGPKYDTQTFEEDMVSDNIETTNENDDCDVINIEPNNASEDFQNHRSQSSNSSKNDILYENHNDQRENEQAKRFEELETMVETSPQNGSAEISSDLETITVSEVEVNGESNVNETEAVDVEFINIPEDIDGSRNEDDIEMSFSQGYHRVFQQEFIEVIQQYNCFQFQNYQYPRFEYPVQENQLNARPTTNLSFLSQRYGELQVPQQMNLVDYNNYRSYRNLDPESRLEITEFFDTDEQKEKEQVKENKTDRENNGQFKSTQVKPHCSSECIQPPVLSQPTWIECNSNGQCPPLQNNQTNHFDLQTQVQIGQRISESSNDTNNNQCKVISQISTHTSSEQRDYYQMYENDYVIQDLDNQQDYQVIQRQNFLQQQLQTPTFHHQFRSQNNTPQGYQELSHIAEFLKNNCHIHGVKFGKINTLHGRLYRTGSLFITFGDHYNVQVLGDVMLKSIDENSAFDAFFSPFHY